MKTTARVGVAVTVGLLACAVPVLTQSAPGTAKFGRFGLDLTSQKQGVKPGDDFWTYANGAWDARTEIAPDRPSAGVGVTVAEEAEVNVRGILDEMGRNPGQYGASGRQIGDFYASWMDVEGIEARGTAPLKPYLDRIAAAKDQAALQVLFASPDYASPVNLGIIPSLSNPTQYTAVVGQGGLGMPRDNYLLPGEKYEGYRAAYRAYVERIQTLAGIRDASAKADAIVTLETAMAKDQWSPEESRNIAKLNDPQTIDGLKAKAPEFDWVLMVKTAGLSASPTVLMTQNTALIAMGKIFAATPVDTWKAYLAYPLHQRSRPVPAEGVRRGEVRLLREDAARACRRSASAGSAACNWSNGALGEAVGELYVAKYFPPEAEAADGRARREPARRATRSASTNSPGWTRRPRRPRSRSSPRSSRRSAIRSSGIDYSSLEVERDDLLGNADARRRVRVAAASSQRLGKPVDRDEWGMTPQTVNAYYNPLIERDRLPGRDPAAAVLRPERRSGGELRRHRRGHRPRDRPRLRRSGPPVRRRRASCANWWTDADERSVQGARPTRSARSTTRSSRCRARTSTAS